MSKESAWAPREAICPPGGCFKSFRFSANRASGRRASVPRRYQRRGTAPADDRSPGKPGAGASCMRGARAMMVPLMSKVLASLMNRSNWRATTTGSRCYPPNYIAIRSAAARPWACWSAFRFTRTAPRAPRRRRRNLSGFAVGIFELPQLLRSIRTATAASPAIKINVYPRQPAAGARWEDQSLPDLAPRSCVAWSLVEADGRGYFCEGLV
jgi:hypothetical protein